MNIHDITFSEKKATRDGFGEGLTEVGSINPKIVALTADLLGSLKMDEFKSKYPNRFFQVGIAEANMMGIAAGLATSGFIPFTGTFANFSTGRVYDQIRQSIAYSEKNVKICASHAGLTLGEDGATHQILEDIGMMRMLPGMVVINPIDSNQTYAAVKAIANYVGPVYLRFGRPSWPVFTSKETHFEIGKALSFGEGNDISLFSTGHMTWQTIEAAKELEKIGISCDVISFPTIKPLDYDAIVKSASKTKIAIVCEEHQKAGGLGDAIAHTLSQFYPTKMGFIGVNDSFGESGNPFELLKKYGLDILDIITLAKQLLNK